MTLCPLHNIPQPRTVAQACLVMPAGSFESYANDVTQLIDHLGLQKVIHIGTSGGGPYACACAVYHPQSTAALGLVASMTHCTGPGSQQLLEGMDWFDRFGNSCVVHAPRLTRLSLALAAPFVHLAAEALVRVVSSMTPANPAVADSSPGGQASSVIRRSFGALSSLLYAAAAGIGNVALYALGLTLPSPDRKALLQHPRVFLRAIPQLLADAFRQGGAGLFADMRITSHPWAFSLSRISAPTVVFQGSDDVVVTVNMARWLGQHIPGAEVRIIPAEAHFSLIVNHAADVLTAMTQRAGVKQQ